MTMPPALTSSNEIRYNDDGQTPLHTLCKNRDVDVDVVRETVNAYPPACKIQDIYGRTPLYYAIKANCSSPAVIDVLCEVYSHAMVLADVCGQCPLYMAYRPGTDESLLARLLHYQPQLTLQRTGSFSGKTLVDSLVRNYEHPQTFPKTSDELWSNTFLADGWNKLLHTLRAAHGCIFPETTMIPELHMALDLWRMDIVSLGLLRNMFVVYAPSQIKLPVHDHLTTTDSAANLRLPLADWVAHCNPVTMKMPNLLCTAAEKGAETTTTITCNSAPPTCRDSIASFGLLDVLQLLVQADPSAVDTMDTHGQYPLHIALSSTLTSLSSSDEMNQIQQQKQQQQHPMIMIKSPSYNSLAAAAAAAATTAVITTTASKDSSTSIVYYQQLIHAAPDVLTIPDPKTRLPPFLLAASNPNVDVDTIYTLLREGPHVLRSLVV